MVLKLQQITFTKIRVWDALEKKIANEGFHDLSTTLLNKLDNILRRFIHVLKVREPVEW